jgi:hypothetical protein
MALAVRGEQMTNHFATSLIEAVEGRTLFSWTPVPVFGQVPPPIIAKAYPHLDKPSVPSKPSHPPTVSSPPPVSEPVVPPSDPVTPVIAAAPTGLKARPCFKAASICLSWKSVDPSAKTIIVEASTDGGKTFSTIAMLDADQKKFGAKHLDRHKHYTFRVYTLDAGNNASPTTDLPVSWVCKKK